MQGRGGFAWCLGRRVNASEPLRRHRLCSLSCVAERWNCKFATRALNLEARDVEREHQSGARCAIHGRSRAYWNTRCAQSQQWASHVSTTTRVCRPFSLRVRDTKRGDSSRFVQFIIHKNSAEDTTKLSGPGQLRWLVVSDPGKAWPMPAVVPPLSFVQVRVI